MKKTMSDLQFKEYVARLTTSELLELMAQISNQAAHTVEMLKEEIELRLMRQAE